MSARPPLVASLRGGPTSNTLTDQMRKHFFGWQCRIRQYSLRKKEGRPTAGMRPVLTIGDELVGHITVLIRKSYSEEHTAQFRYMVKKTNDPAERYQNAMQVLSSAYYQKSREFSDELTALFGPDSPTAERIVSAGAARLAFSEYNQSYELPCQIRRLAVDSEAFQATFWHNSLFNPNLPGDVVVLGFQPDWAGAIANPPIE